MASMSANKEQIGGSHYKDLPIQPAEYAQRNRLGFIEGCVVKYVTRHKSKGGRQDLEKAIHFLRMLVEMEYPQEMPEVAFIRDASGKPCGSVIFGADSGDAVEIAGRFSKAFKPTPEPPVSQPSSGWHS